MYRDFCIAMPLLDCRFDFSGNGESEGRFRYGNYNEEVPLHDILTSLACHVLSYSSIPHLVFALKCHAEIYAQTCHAHFIAALSLHAAF